MSEGREKNLPFWLIVVKLIKNRMETMMKTKFRISWFIRIGPNSTVNQEVIADEDSSYYIVRSLLLDPCVNNVMVDEYEAELYTPRSDVNKFTLVFQRKTTRPMIGEDWLRNNFNSKIEKVFEGESK